MKITIETKQDDFFKMSDSEEVSPEQPQEVVEDTPPVVEEPVPEPPPVEDPRGPRAARTENHVTQGFGGDLFSGTSWGAQIQRPTDIGR